MKKLVLVLVLGLILVTGCTKYVTVEKTVEIPVTVEKIVTQNVTVEVPKIVTQNITIEKIVYQAIYIKEWESLDQLTEWCNEHITYIFSVGGKEADCDDYSLYLQREAYTDGYLISCQLVLNGYLNNVKVTNETGSHMGCIAFIDNGIYYIEPNPEDYHITYVCPLD